MEKPDLTIDLEKVASAAEAEAQLANVDQRPVDIVIVDLNNREINQKVS